FGLRRDRIRLLVWIAAVVFLTVVSLLSFVANYPTETDRMEITAGLDSPAMTALTGPDHYLTHYTYASMLGHQLTYLIAIALAIMTVLLVVRHTRMEEETGRAELRSEEHTSELQSRENLVCRLLLEKKKSKTAAR